jgi:hypothetical protein
MLTLCENGAGGTTMRKAGQAITSFLTAGFFTVGAVVNPREAVDNPHTLQEMPTEPDRVETLGGIMSTFTGTASSIGRLDSDWITTRELQGHTFRVVLVK